MNLQVVEFKVSVKKMLLMAGLVLLLVSGAYAQDSFNNNLLEILESKGILSSQEVTALQKKEAANPEAGAAAQEALVLLLKKKGVLTEEDAAFILGGEAAQDDSLNLSQEASPALGGKESGKELVGVLDDGFCLKTRDGSARFHLKGLLQTDYKAYDYDLEPEGIGTDPGTDGFDIRRARLITKGKLSPLFDFAMSYEFQGVNSRRLLDAYVNARIHDAFSLRAGQFKEPFGLEALSSDSDLFFTERSMGFGLNPGRDVGVMAFGGFWDNALYYRLGVFNGDGMDDASGGNVDEPEVCARIGAAPFAHAGIPLLQGFHLGASGSYQRADANTVSLDISTAGRTDFFSLATNAKFSIIRNCDTLIRHGADAAWTYGPVALFGEYIQARYDDVESKAQTFDAEMTGYYGAGAWIITGEPVLASRGAIQPVIPANALGDGGYGALGLAFRYDNFDAGDKVYDTLVFVGDSVREAEAMTFGLNWYLNQYARLSLEFTRTTFDQPLLIYRDSSTGTSLYSDKEDLIISRFQLGF